MDGATRSPFLRHSWFHFSVKAAGTKPLCFQMESHGHAVSLTIRGRHSVRWLTRGRETRWTEASGTVNFTPRDGERHIFVTEMSPDFESAVFFIPDGHLRCCLAADGLEPPTEFRRVLDRDDPILQACLTRLATLAGAGGADGELRRDESARRLVLRLAELQGGTTPDWAVDGSVFDWRTMARVVEYIDEHLLVAPSLTEMGLLVGLSPSHFAKKFRQSAGLSLHRFVNRRRVNRSLELLQTAGESLAGVALDLGFSSQSHFTRLFSDLTGMTPARYRKMFRRIVG